MHVSPAKHSYGNLTDGRTDRRMDRQTTDKVIPMCRYTSQATQKWWQHFEECMCRLQNIAMGVWQTDGRTDGQTDGRTDRRRTKWSLCVLRRQHKNQLLNCFVRKMHQCRLSPTSRHSSSKILFIGVVGNDPLDKPVDFYMKKHRKLRVQSRRLWLASSTVRVLILAQPNLSRNKRKLRITLYMY